MQSKTNKQVTVILYVGQDESGDGTSRAGTPSRTCEDWVTSAACRLLW